VVKDRLIDERADQVAVSGTTVSVTRPRVSTEAMELELVAVRVDAAMSAKSLERPGLQRVLAELGAGVAQGVLVAKLDRLTRSVRDLGWLLEPSRFGERWWLLSVADSIDTRSAAGGWCCTCSRA
jgi:hypothetical protein